MISISDGKDSKTDIQPSGLLTNKYIQYEPKSKSLKGKPFVVEAVGDSITVTVENEVFYPKGVQKDNQQQTSEDTKS